MSRALNLPPAISLYPTTRCPLRCSHCFLVQQGIIGKYDLPFETCKAIVGDAAKNQVFMIVVGGGDPFLYPYFFQLIEDIKAKNMLPLIGISGMIISDRIIGELKRLAIDTLQISPDGSRSMPMIAVGN